MIKLILSSTISFIIGIFAGYLIHKLKKNSELCNMLYDFKKTIEEYKAQSVLTSKEVKDAIKDASKLAGILTTNQNLKGQFAEDTLEVILNACYPQKNIHYIKQLYTKNEDEKEIKPDYIVNLPNNKAIAIDCKLNIDKFILYKDTNNPSYKSEFIKDINATINNLSNKKYHTIHNLNQPDFILMYTPLEAVINLIYTDKDFLSVIKNANDKNILIVGNSSILATIRLANLIWAKDTQEKNIEKIVNTAQTIYTLIAQHSQALYNMKTLLNDTTVKFNKEYENLTQNNKLFKSAEELREYGIQISTRKNGKKLDEIAIQSDFLEK